MLNGIVIIVSLVTFVIIFIIAKMMVKKHICLARRCVIGKDSPEKLEELKNLAKSMLTKGTFSMPTDFNDAEKYDFSVELNKQKNEITIVRIKTEKTLIICSSENPEPVVFHNGISERGATIFVFVGLLAMLLLVLFFVLLLGIILL